MKVVLSSPQIEGSVCLVAVSKIADKSEKVVIYPSARFQELSSVYFYDWEVELGGGGFGLSLYKNFSL